jgi:hypothetical protein
MDLILQAWGGSFYLINKILFALAEGKTRQKRRQLRLYGWAIYILGLPAWVIILVGKHDWIAAALEAGALPSMVLGLSVVYHDSGRPNPVLGRITSWVTYAFISTGICYSLYDYGGLATLSQVLEMGATVGFLLGSYLLATNNTHGWLLFMLMNGSMGTLMLIQGKPILAVQQLVSLCFVLYGFAAAVRANHDVRNTIELP